MHIFHIVDSSLKQAGLNHFVEELSGLNCKNTIMRGSKEFFKLKTLFTRPVIHIHGVSRIILILPLINMFNKKIISTIYLESIKNLSNDKKINKRLKKIIKYSDLILINEKEVLNYLDIKGKNIQWQPIGYFSKQDVKSLDVQLKINSVIYIESDINDKSNIHIIIESMRYYSNAFLLICRYKNIDEGYMKHLNALAENLSVENQITYVDEFENDVEYDYFILDSKLLENYEVVFKNLIKGVPVLIYDANEDENYDFGLSYIKSKAPKTIAYNVKDNIRKYEGVKEASMDKFSYENCAKEYHNFYDK